MKSGACPKCKSDEILNDKDGGLWTHAYFANTINLGMFRTANLDNYVCGHGGYVERYVASGRDLEKIRGKLKRISR